MLNKAGRSNLLLLTIVALLVSLAGCATPDVGRVVVAPRQESSPPPSIQQPPPEANFQQRLRNFFLNSQPTPTEQPNMQKPVMTGR